MIYQYFRQQVINLCRASLVCFLSKQLALITLPFSLPNDPRNHSDSESWVFVGSFHVEEDL
jgi:hypothetical protein